MDAFIRQVQDRYVPQDSWFIRYRLYHIPFWFLYHTGWFLLNAGNLAEVVGIWSTPYVVKFLFYIIFQAAGVYFNLYYLIPGFLERQKYWQYLLLLILTIIVTTSLIVSGYHITAWLSPMPFKDIWGVEKTNFFHFFNKMALPSTMASMTLAMSFKFAKNWIGTQRRQQALEKEQLETELKFLKSQFNPHFLFNTINSIFVLINKNPKMASESLAKFSDLLRYQLYECNEHQIRLDQEVSYLENFIELEKLRQDHDQLELNISTGICNSSGLYIAPFVLMPFVENAFKHVSRQSGTRNWIKIDLSLQDHYLQLLVSNSTYGKGFNTNQLVNYGGIGLRNIQRRLDLQYPLKHVLTITEDPTQYKVQLKLNLETAVAGTGVLTSA